MKITATKRTTHLLIFLTIVVCFSSVSLIAINGALFFSDHIYNGIRIGTIPVGGLSVENAKNKIIANFKDQTTKSKITIRYENKVWTITPQEIELTMNAEVLAEKAYNTGRTGNLINLLQERYSMVNDGYTIPFNYSYNHDKLYEVLTTIATSINHNPQNAALTYQSGDIHITPERWGWQVDLPTAIADIDNKLKVGIPLSSELTVIKQTPTLLSQEFANIDSLLAVYTTDFNPNNSNRSKNIEIAANHINKILLHAGEIFSFNQRVGLRLPEYGYKEAPVLVDGKLLLDWGGGVCQVSTTLYNTALLADMNIEERTSHFQPPSYVPLGQDAAVADNLLDFSFKNTSPDNIYITSEVLNNQITVSIFGKKILNSPKINIETTSKTVLFNTLIKQDHSLAVGNEIIESVGQNGFEVSTYRVKVSNGKEISREHLSSDEFAPEDQIIRVGTIL